MASEAEDAPERPGRPIRKGLESVEPARGTVPVPEEADLNPARRVAARSSTQLEEHLRRTGEPPSRRLQRRLEEAADVTTNRAPTSALAQLKQERLIAYIAECHADKPQVAEACADYRQWQDFWATRLIDEETCQKHAYEECNAVEQREYCALIATLQQATRKGKTGHRPPASSKYQKKRNLEGWAASRV